MLVYAGVDWDCTFWIYGFIADVDVLAGIDIDGFYIRHIFEVFDVGFVGHFPDFFAYILPILFPVLFLMMGGRDGDAGNFEFLVIFFE